jgi:hypothetical protein
MDLENHPGYLGLTSRGVVAIHADWPAYAIGHGAAYALERLGQFPEGTSFFGIDDIDQCVLLRVGPQHPNKSDFDETHFHVAVWHEDLLELFSKHWVEGLAGITPREWAVRRCEELKGVVWQLADGQPIPPPDPEDFEDEQATIAVVSADGMRLTNDGMGELRSILAARPPSLPPPLADRVEPLIKVRAYDAAVRDACVFLEVHLRVETASDFFGSRLVEEYCTQVHRRVIGAYAKWLRSELRTCFRFVRNDFMHNLRDLNEEQCLALVCRVADVYSLILKAR